MPQRNSAGKTHYLIGLERAAVTAGYKVRYFTAIELVEHLYRALADNTVGKAIDAVCAGGGRSRLWVNGVRLGVAMVSRVVGVLPMYKGSGHRTAVVRAAGVASVRSFHGGNAMFHTRSRPTADTPAIRQRSMFRSRWAAVGAAVAVAVGGGGIWHANATGSDRTPATFVPVTPCRLFDTRVAPQTVGARSTPLGAGESAVFGVRGTNGNCTLPTDVQAVVMNVTAKDMTKASFLTVYPADVERPTTSNLNWTPDADAIANAVTTAVSADGAIAIYNNAGTTDVVADVVGYYTSLNLTNYYTKQEVQQLIAATAGPAGPAGPPGAAGPPGDSALANLSCTTNQIIRYANGAWACSNDHDTLAALNCTSGQTAAFDGTNWICRGHEIVATLTRPPNSPSCCGPNSVFPTHSADIVDMGCVSSSCAFRLVDILDQTTCSVQLADNSLLAAVTVTVTVNEIRLDHVDQTDQSEPLTVTITCSP